MITDEKKIKSAINALAKLFDSLKINGINGTEALLNFTMMQLSSRGMNKEEFNALMERLKELYPKFIATSKEYKKDDPA